MKSNTMKSNTMKIDDRQSEAVDNCIRRCRASLNFLDEVRFSYLEASKSSDTCEKELFEEILGLANDAHELLSLSLNRGKQFRSTSRRSMLRFIVSATEQNCVPDATDLKRMRNHCFTPLDFAVHKKVLKKDAVKVVGS